MIHKSFERGLIHYCELSNGKVGIDWIVLAQDRDRWRALVNVVMNIQVP